jgi:hypothetical protein
MRRASVVLGGHVPRRFGGLGLALLLAAMLVPAELPAQRPQGTASISGVVVSLDMRTPVRRAQVTAVSEDRVEVEASTDDAGRYVLEGLPAGRWRVIVRKGGYVRWQYRQQRPFETPEPLVLADGARATANVILPRGGAIAGRLSGEHGEPLAGIEVQAYRVRMEDGRPHLQAAGVGDRTDDTGAYRLYALAPGSFYVSASRRQGPPDSVNQTTYTPTYYPGTADLAEAQRIRLALGGEGSAVFALPAPRWVRVAGSVLTGGGAPGDALLALHPRGTGVDAWMQLGGATKPDGTFVIPSVPPGQYTLLATSRGATAGETGSVPLAVGDRDVNGVVVVTGRSGSIRGVFEPEVRASGPVPGEPRVLAKTARPPGQFMDSGNGLAFSLTSLPEPFYLDVEDLAAGWIVKEILLDGADVTDEAISVDVGQRAEMRIVVTDRLSGMAGTIAESDAIGSRTAIVFPDDPAKWEYRSRYVRFAEADAAGRFRIDGLPPGLRYRAFATNYLEPGEETDPEFLALIRPYGTLIDVRDGETAVVSLEIVER